MCQNCGYKVHHFDRVGEKLYICHVSEEEEGKENKSSWYQNHCKNVVWKNSRRSVLKFLEKKVDERKWTENEGRKRRGNKRKGVKEIERAAGGDGGRVAPGAEVIEVARHVYATLIPIINQGWNWYSVRGLFHADFFSFFSNVIAFEKKSWRERNWIR